MATVSILTNSTVAVAQAILLLVLLFLGGEGGLEFCDQRILERDLCPRAVVIDWIVRIVIQILVLMDTYKAITTAL